MGITSRAPAALLCSLLLLTGLVARVPAHAGSRQAETSCLDRAGKKIGTEGDDVLRGTRWRDVIIGLGGNDTILGLGNDDVICGGEGDDWIEGGAMADLLSGGPGDDTLVAGDGGADLSGTWIDKLQGDDGADTLFGGPDNDELSGGLGADVIEGAEGDDFIYTGQYELQRSTVDTSADVTRGGGGRDRIVSDGGSDLLQGEDDVDLLFFNGTGAPTLEGGPGDDHLALNAEPGGRADGGEGNDSIVDGPGIDSIEGGVGRDTLSFPSSVEGVTVDLTDGTAVGAGTDAIAGIEDVHATEVDDRLIGDGGDNTLVGGTGNDEIEGLDGNDHLRGGGDTGCSDYYPGSNDGDDVITGGNGDDFIYGGPFGCWTGDGEDDLSGDGGDDMIYGAASQDTLSGGLGADYLNGMEDPDSINAGDDADTCARDGSDTTSACEVLVDPVACGDGNDNDHDSTHDMTDPGCRSLEDDYEGLQMTNAFGNSARDHRIEGFDPQTRKVTGQLWDVETRCQVDRPVVVEMRRRGPNDVVARTTTDENGAWSAIIPPRSAGRVQARAPVHPFTTPRGEIVECPALTAWGDVFVPAEERSARQLEASLAPRSSGPLDLDHYDCGAAQRYVDNVKAGVWNTCVRFYRFDPAAARDDGRNYGVAWVQATAHGRNGFCPTKLPVTLLLEGARAEKIVPAGSREVRRTSGTTTRLRVDAGDTARDVGSLSQTWVARPGRYDAWLARRSTRLRALWKNERGSRKTIAIVTAVEVSWPQDSRPPKFDIMSLHPHWSPSLEVRRCRR